MEKQAYVLLSEVRSVIEIQIWKVLNTFIQNEQKIYWNGKKRIKTVHDKILSQWPIYKPINKFQMNIHKMLVPFFVFFCLFLLTKDNK